MTMTKCFFLFFFNDTATTEIYTLSLHDALPISRRRRTSCSRGCPASAAGRGLCAGAESRRVPQRKLPTAIRGGELAKRCDVEPELRGGRDVERQPGGRDRSKDVSVRERKHAATAGGGAAREVEELLRSCVDVRRRLPSRASVVVDLPARPRGPDLSAG